MSTVNIGVNLRRLVDDLGYFAGLIGHPLTPTQQAALTLATPMTVVVAPRQTGKSTALAALALWWAFRKPDQSVLIVSASEDASKELLAKIQAKADHPLLAGSRRDETAARLVLSNGSVIVSVPASQRAIRGRTVDCLIVDESAFVDDSLIEGAAFPTITARPDARVVLAGTPGASTGVFYRQALAGLGDSLDVRTYRWRLDDAPWISNAWVEQMRASLSPERFAMEYMADFIAASDLFFDPADLTACTVGYAQLLPADARGEAVVMGIDWGRVFDRHAVAAVGVLDDGGVNPRSVLFVPYAETSQRTYGEQVDRIVAMARPVRRVKGFLPRFYGEDTGVITDRRYTIYEDVRQMPPIGRNRPTTMPPLPPSQGYGVVTIVPEQNGVGAMPAEQLAERLPRVPVEGVHTSQRSKEDAYGRLRLLLAQRRLVLPDYPELQRQLRGISYEATASGAFVPCGPEPERP